MIEIRHYGPDGFGGTAHEGEREDCPRPECAWPRMGDRVTAMTHDVERTGELVDFHVIRTSPGNEYSILRSTIREPDWGVYCPHGLKIVGAVPAEHTCGRPGGDPPGRFRLLGPGSSDCPACYPADRKVQPWPCREGGCTEADFDKAAEAEIEEYWEAVNEHARIPYEQ